MSVIRLPTLLLTCAAALVGAGALAQADAGAADAGSADAGALSPQDQFVWELKNRSRLEVLESSERAIAQLGGAYRYRMMKQERVDDELLEVQEIVTTVQEDPFAIRFDYAAGPGKGRVILYNPAVNKDRFRVRESGFLSIVGAIWLDVDSSLAKKESKHTVREGGLMNLARRLRRDVVRGIPEGGFAEKHEGWNNKGSWCSLYLSPNGGKGYDAFSTRLCTDPVTRYPTKVEGFDSNGRLLERYEFFNVEKVTLPKDYFTPQGAGL